MRNNELEHLPPDLFSNMTKLAQLVLSGNRLKTVDGNLFAHMPGKIYHQPALLLSKSHRGEKCVMTERADKFI